MNLTIERNKDEFTKYERARIIGSRALQISQGAPIFLKLSKKELEELKYNPVEIARREFEADVIPIGIKRIMPYEREAAKKKEQ